MSEIFPNELQVSDIQIGDGLAAIKGALITTHYTGYLENGTVFDSSHERGKPFQCVIGKVTRHSARCAKAASDQGQTG